MEVEVAVMKEGGTAAVGKRVVNWLVRRSAEKKVAVVVVTGGCDGANEVGTGVVVMNIDKCTVVLEGIERIPVSPLVVVIVAATRVMRIGVMSAVEAEECGMFDGLVVSEVVGDAAFVFDVVLAVFVAVNGAVVLDYGMVVNGRTLVDLTVVCCCY